MRSSGYFETINKAGGVVFGKPVLRSAIQGYTTSFDIDDDSLGFTFACDIRVEKNFAIMQPI
jgi:hypothetical protein